MLQTEMDKEDGEEGVRDLSEAVMGCDVSVIIVSWNTRDILCDCLESIYEQTSDIAFEVIVVDNASSDGSAGMVRAEFPEVTVVANLENRGFAVANNQGITIANGRYILLLNSDTIVLDRAIQKTIVFADQHPDAAAVGCQVWDSESSIQRTCFGFPSVWGLLVQKSGLCCLFPKSRLLGQKKMVGWERDCERNVDVVSGMFMLVRREAIEQVGVMDEDYFVYAEETDWCFRFWRAGWRCVFTPRARIIHRDGGGKSTQQVSAKMYMQQQKSLLIFFGKRRGRMSWLAAKTIYIVSLLGRYVLFWLWGSLGTSGDSRTKAEQSLVALRFHIFGKEPE